MDRDTGICCIGSRLRRLLCHKRNEELGIRRNTPDKGVVLCRLPQELRKKQGTLIYRPKVHMWFKKQELAIK